MTSLWEFSPGDTCRFCLSRNGGTQGGWWVLPKGENGVAQPWTGHRKPLLRAGWAVSLLFFFFMNGRRKQPCHLVGPPFQAPMASFFFALEWVGIACANTRYRVGMARFANLLRVACFTSVCSLKHENLRELNLGCFSDPQVEKQI